MTIPLRLRLRPSEPGDHALLLRVFASTRGPELAALAADPAGADAFIAQQFQAQDRSWRAAATRPAFDLVLAVDEPIGRLVVDRRDDEIRLVDISLLPDHRGRGIGTRLITDLIAEAEAAGLPLVLHVFFANPARGLYERLGFTVAGDDQVHLRMVRTPGQAKTAS